MIRRMRGSAMLAGFALLLATAPAVAAHGAGSDLPPLDVGTALTAWSLDPIISLVLIAFGAAYLLAFRAVNRRHPASPVRAWRAAAWIGGLLAVAFALEGSPDVYAEALFSVHMVQHLLLVAIAAPLFALAAPVTLLLRVVSPANRTRFVLPVLQSRLVGVMTHPLVAWIVFAVVMWGSHFSPLFDAALENPLIHHFEHALYLGAGMLFWWPVVAADPVRHRLGWTARIAYLGTALPWNSFLGVAIYFAPNVLYAHYGTTVRTWGPTPLLDQQAAGAVMWVGGDLAFLVALLLVIAGLLADEERKGRIYDARMDARAH
jgi:cytochrome c oxidase assembly factor CtaG